MKVILRKRLTIASALIVIVAVVCGVLIWRMNASGSTESASPSGSNSEGVSLAEAISEPVNMQKLVGRWLRTDSPYVIEIREVSPDGTLRAGYYNPQPINVSAAKVENNNSTLQVFVETPWEWERFDAFTHYLGMEYLNRVRPRLLYMAYGDTDEYAHSGDYSSYLTAANRTDAFIAQLWNWVQSTEGYRDHTTFVITTDHGRGAGERWIGHGADWEGSDAIWVAVLGPDTPAQGEVRERGQLYQNQIASTVALPSGASTSKLPNTPHPP